MTAELNISAEVTTPDVPLAAAPRRVLDRRQYLGIVIVLAVACVPPFVLGNYHIFQLTLVLVYAIALLGLNMLTGYNGQISLGHGTFFAIGAYTAAILIDKAGVPYWATIPVAGVLCLVAGFLFGLPALRLEGLYLALATFALGVATAQILKHKAIEHWTGGAMGIVIVKPDPPAALPLTQDQWIYFFCLFWAVLLFFAAWNLLRGRIGRALVATRDDPIAAQAMGVDTAIYKSLTFGVSALYAGVAGRACVDCGAVRLARLVHDLPVAVASDRHRGWWARLHIRCDLRALFIVFVPNIADEISKAAPWAIYGVFLIGVMYVMPSGVAGLMKKFRLLLTQKKESR